MFLSILIPVYNAAQHLPLTLKSILEQKRGDFQWEVVAVDDGSQDESLSLLQKEAEQFAAEGISLRIVTGPNRGVAEARNRLVQEAAGEFLLFLDSDDRLFPEALFTLWKTQRETNADMILFDAESEEADGSRLPFSTSEAPQGPMTPRDCILAHPAPWNRLIRKELFLRSSLKFCPNIWYEDLSVIPALAANAKENGIYYRKEPLYLYVQSQNSITRSAYSPKRLDIFPALLHLKQSLGEAYRTEAEYLAWFHLYRTFVWIFWKAGQEDALNRCEAFMKEHFPYARQNPLVRSRHSRKERFLASLFDANKRWILTLWKGKPQ